jgi:diacylglycerol kinase family enzyme
MNGHLYTEAADAGLFVDFMALTCTDGRKRLPRTLYATSRLFAVNRAYPMRLTIDGKRYDDTLSLCLVANSYRVGMAISVAVGATMTNGRLNVVMIEALRRKEW